MPARKLKRIDPEIIKQLYRSGKSVEELYTKFEGEVEKRYIAKCVMEANEELLQEQDSYYYIDYQNGIPILEIAKQNGKQEKTVRKAIEREYKRRGYSSIAKRARLSQIIALFRSGKTSEQIMKFAKQGNIIITEQQIQLAKNKMTEEKEEGER